MLADTSFHLIFVLLEQGKFTIYKNVVPNSSHKAFPLTYAEVRLTGMTELHIKLAEHTHILGTHQCLVSHVINCWPRDGTRALAVPTNSVITAQVSAKHTLCTF